MRASLYFAQTFEAASLSDLIDLEQIQEKEMKAYAILLLILYTVVI